MRVLAIILGFAGIWVVGQEAFETVVLPRRVTRRLRFTQIFYSVVRTAWKAFRLVPPGPRRESYLSYFGPLSLLALFAFWAALFVLAFGTLLWGLAVPLVAPAEAVGFATYLYLSGTTFFTLGLGDVTVASGPARFLLVAEVAFGFSFLALAIGYVPVFYQAFSRRERRISLLDARAGSPPSAVEMLRRNCAAKYPDELLTILHDWEEWCADILESHLSYPVLAYYRSQHQSQSWVEALTVILDTCALVLTGLDGIPARPARFAFAMARHTAVDLAQVFDVPPQVGADRLPPDDFARLRNTLAQAGIPFRDAAAERKLAEIRRTYEPFVTTLAHDLMVALPPWLAPIGRLDDWQTSAWDDLLPSTRQALLEVMGQE